MIGLAEVGEDNGCGNGDIKALGGGSVWWERWDTQRMRNQFSDLGRKSVALVAHNNDAGTFVGDSIGRIEVLAIKQGAVNWYTMAAAKMRKRCTIIVMG